MSDLAVFWDLSILIGIAAALGLVANRLKQPLILGYIAAGVIMQYSGLLDMHNVEGFTLFSQIGIVFLLFILGLELNVKELGSLGAVSLVTGIGQIVFTVGIGLLLALGLGYEFGSGLILAIGLTFSSTIVIVKLLSSKQDLDSLYGKISIGFLLVQDLVAIVILILLSASLNAGVATDPVRELILLVLKGIVVASALYLINEFLIPPLIKLTGHDREVMFVSVIALALVVSAAVSATGLSLEIGALAAGIALSNRKEALQIESWMRPLRDFFITVFFVLLGFEIQIGEIGSSLLPAIVFSVFVLVGNPVIVLILLRMMGFNSKTGFLAGLTVAQISEFSLLVASLALEAEQISQADLTMLTIVGGITMTGSSYMILYNEQLYEKLRPILKYFDPKHPVRQNYSRKHVRDRIVVFGFNRMARSLHDVIEEGGQKFLVVDNDMEMLKKAENMGATVAFGDLQDMDLLHGLKLDQANLIISTVPNRQANLSLLYYISEQEIGVPVIVNAFKDEDAVELYEAGADFVLHPYILSGDLLHKIATKEHPVTYLHRVANKDLSVIGQ